MAQKQIGFAYLDIGDTFVWHDTKYTKIAGTTLQRYGYVNALGPAFYAGDTGHRYFDNDRLVTVEDADHDLDTS
jgi:hypothetical protein